MAFNGYQQYLKDQRRARRWDRILVLIVIASILGIIAVAFHGAYVRSHAKPKPAAAEVTFYDVQTSGYEPGHVIGNPGTVWIKCSAGMDVTDLADCPEYKNEGAYLAYIAAQARKHKRRHGSFWYVADDPYERFSVASMVPAELACIRHRKTSSLNCTSRPLTPDEIKMYQPIAETTPAFGPNTQDTYDWGVQHETTPQDITNLMEQIAPTKPAEMEHVYRCPDGTLTNGECPKPTKPIVEWNCGAGNCGRTDAGGITWFPDGSMQCLGDHDCPAPTPAEIRAHQPKKPDCRMPADIDVCPQTVDPKGSHD